MTAAVAKQTTTVAKRSGRLVAARVVAGLLAALSVLAGGWGSLDGFLNPTDIHAVHGIGGAALIGVLFGSALVVISIQPQQAAVQQVLVVSGAALVASVLAGNLGAFALVMVALAALMAALARQPMIPQRLRVASPALGLAAAAVALPLLAYGWGQIELQGGPLSEHVQYEHYLSQGALAFALTGTLALASLQSPGWRVNGWSGGLALVLMGLASLVSGQVSAFPTPWAMAALVTGAIVIGITEW